MSFDPQSFADGPREDPFAGETAEEPVAAEAVWRPIDQIRAELTALKNKTTSWAQAAMTFVVPSVLMIVREAMARA